MPLLEDLNVTQDYSDSEDETKATTKDKKDKKNKKNEKNKRSKDSKKSDKKSKKGAKESVYDAPDEYAGEKRRRLINTRIKSERFNWSKKFQFPEEFITIVSPENDLTAIRDTLETRVNVKLIYYKVTCRFLIRCVCLKLQFRYFLRRKRRKASLLKKIRVKRTERKLKRKTKLKIKIKNLRKV